jgi:hypothetical protein
VSIAPARPQIAALKALLTAGGLTVLDGGDGSPTAPCVVLWPTPGEPTSSTLADPSSDLEVDVVLHACGDTADQAMWVADKIGSLLDRKTPTISGRTTRPIRMLESTPVRRSDSLAAPVWYAATRWRITTGP